ncbi:hypothetical protein Q760_10120 [Cellulomonas cellasea DSM 20118]|uniref:Zinc-ribbon 15 domain-containing protein n=2 Tax=Cellulomonas cellasea TaxID=43670 RepID=A0A0A0BD63_9CELL|nr:hypothetical protein Q760_10120 [Cellulomonas cellasea DSM 20118]GEA87227.1 hypothetical protein CCE01nite_11760 [Cellulomonas cellasea]
MSTVFLIWGMRVLNAVLGTGQFHCPRCGVDAEYRRVQPRQWFTFFFLPVVPLRRLEPHVECTQCGTAFRDAVLAEPTTQLFEYQVGLANRAAVAHLVASSGAPGPVLREPAVALLASSAGVAPTYDAAALAQDVAAFADPDVALAYLRPLAQTMTTEGREEFLRRVLTFADRHDRTADRSALLAGYAAALGLSAAHAAGIAATVRRADGSHPGGAA